MKKYIDVLMIIMVLTSLTFAGVMLVTANVFYGRVSIAIIVASSVLLFFIGRNKLKKLKERGKSINH